MKRVKFFFIFLLPAILLLALPHSVLAETKTFSVTKDTYANQAYPSDPKGSVGSITISNKYTTRLGYVQFEDISLPEGAVLDRGIFKFYVHEVHYSDKAKLNVGPISADWEENTLTWNNKPTIDQTQAIETEISLVAGWKEIPITYLVRQWREGSRENKGIFIYPFGFLYGTAETEYAFSFKSKEAGEDNPKLEVVYHFEPTPTPTLTPTPTPKPKATPTPTEELTPSPTPEETPTPTPEEEKAGLILGIFSPGQAIIGGLIVLALIGAGIAFAAYSRRKPVKKPEEKKEEE